MAISPHRSHQRRTGSEIQEILQAQRQSGLSVLRFCKENGYAYSTFNLWQTRFAGERGDARLSKRNIGKSKPFGEVRLVASDSLIGSSVRIHTQSGHCVEVSLGGNAVDGLLDLLSRLR